MAMRKTLSLVGSMLILGLGLAFAQEKSQERVRNEVGSEIQKREALRSQTKEKASQRFQYQRGFIDENGDGINDYFRDHDNDGIPNCQDPDWERVKDGTGYMNKYRNSSSSNQREIRNRYYSGKGWNKASFRQNMANFGKRVCTGLGPKGMAKKFRGR